MKQQLTRTFALVSLVTTACASPGAVSRPTSSREAPATAKAPPSPAEARESLRAAEAAMAEALARKGSAEGLVASAAPDALLLMAGEYALRGTEAIRARLTAEPLEKEGVLSAQALVWDVSADGRMGYAVGQVRIDATGSEPGTAPSSGTGSAPAPAPGSRPAAASSPDSKPAASSAPGSRPAAASAPAPDSKPAASSAPGSRPAAASAPDSKPAASSAASSAGSASAPVPQSAAPPGTLYQRYLTAWTRTPEGPWRLAVIVLGRSRGPLAVPPSFSVASIGALREQPSAPSDVLAEAFAADSAFSEQSGREGMGKAFIAWAAPDAIIPGGPSGFFGQAAIEQGYAPITREKVDLRWQPVLGAAASSGDMAYTVGRAVSVSPGPDGKPETRYTKYLSVWRLQPDGQWRYVADSGNGSPGPDGP